MKLVTYDPGSGPRAGVLADDRVLDVSALLGSSTTLRDVRALLEFDDAALDRLRSALTRQAAPSVPLAEVRLRAPVLQPPTVRDFMAFEGHASGGGKRKLADGWYRMPIFYFSNTLRISGPEEEVPFPSATDRLDYELELGCVIGREGTDVRAADGLNYIAGFTTDEMAPYRRDGRLHVKCSVRVNGQTWMDKGDASQMHHTWGDFVERASHDSRIVPGDVFGTGTVSGGTVGEAQQRGLPARYLQPGDVVELEVEGIGTLRNRLGPKKEVDPGYRYGAPRAATAVSA